jgi:hypothetical protein
MQGLQWHWHESASELNNPGMFPLYRNGEMPQMRWKWQISDSKTRLSKELAQTGATLGRNNCWTFGVGVTQI